jgi:maltose O-acetyltransferase
VRLEIPCETDGTIAFGGTEALAQVGEVTCAPSTLFCEIDMTAGPGESDGSNFDTGERKHPEKLGGLKKLLAVAREELRGIHPRYRVAQLLVSCLPQNSFCRVRTMLYRLAGLRIGKGTLVLGRLTLTSDGSLSKMLSIGFASRVNAPFFADLNAPVIIGSNVAIGHHVVLITTDHDKSNPEHRGGTPKFERIVIEDGAMIGACVTILPGVTIGRGSVVSAGALVSQSVLANRLVGGVPARPIKTLDG